MISNAGIETGTDLMRQPSTEPSSLLIQQGIQDSDALSDGNQDTTKRTGDEMPPGEGSASLMMQSTEELSLQPTLMSIVASDGSTGERIGEVRFQNRPIERYHNEIRETLKARRGLGNDESTQRYADAYKDYHNFARPHSGLNVMTPVEAAGIDLGLGHDRIKDLITKGAEAKRNFAVQLGKRIEKVSISNEKDCIKVHCKRWVEKQTRREINDILWINGCSDRTQRNSIAEHY